MCVDGDKERVCERGRWVERVRKGEIGPGRDRVRFKLFCLCVSIIQQIPRVTKCSILDFQVSCSYLYLIVSL